MIFLNSNNIPTIKFASELQQYERRASHRVGSGTTSSVQHEGPQIPKCRWERKNLAGNWSENECRW